MKNEISRRVAVKSSLFGVLGVCASNVLYSKNILAHFGAPNFLPATYQGYPAIHPDVVSEVVGVSHFNLDRLKELVEPRPELARATWDWAFGDWETAIGAASHVGRKDIVDYLLTKGARPDIFTFAMLGKYEIVKSIIDYSPSMLHIAGPHGISLLQHVKSGLSDKTSDNTDSNKLIDYLSSLDHSEGPQYMDVAEIDKAKYLGDYKYGEGDSDGFSIKLNMRKLLAFGRLGKFGGALYKTADNTFTYNGTPSISISFQEENGKIVSLTIKEPSLVVIAKKI
jgi:hypothetical protein